MKKSFFKSLLPILGGAFLCIVLAGCENFLKGADVKQQLDNAVEYANARACKLYLKSESDQGSFLTQGQVECRVGFAVDLQFTLNKEYWYFESLQAVAAADEKQSRADCVEFTLNDKKSDPEKGIYVISTKLLKAAEDVLIKPKCVEIPCVTKYTPQSGDSQYANTPITVFFNYPVEEESLEAKDSLFNYTNITFKTIDYSEKEKDMSSYFYKPEFNKEKTVLKIFPKTTELKTYMANPGNGRSLNFLDVRVSFSENIVIKKDNYSLPLKQDSNSSFTIRYNPQSEDDAAPSKSLLYGTKEKIIFSSAPTLPKSSQFKEDGIDFNQKDRNLVSSTFYIYGKYYDKDSGVRSVKVTESNIYDMYSDQLTIPKERTYYEDSDNIIFEDNGDGYKSFIITYNMQEAAEENPSFGFFKITVTVNDACENSSAADSFNVVYLEYGDLGYITKYKKSSNEYPAYNGLYIQGNDVAKFSVYNTPFTKSALDQTHYDFASYYSDIKKIRIMDEYKPTRFYILGAKRQYYTGGENEDAWCITGDKVTYSCEYIDKNGVKQNEPFSEYAGPGQERFVVLDIDKFTDVSFTVIARYNGIIIGRKQFTFPPAITFSAINIDQIKPNQVAGIKQGGLMLYSDGSYDFVMTNRDNPDTISLSKLPANSKLYVGNIASLDKDFTSGYDYTFNNSTNKYTPQTTSSSALNYKYTDSTFTSEKIRYEDVLFGEMAGPYKYGQSSTIINDWNVPASYDIRLSEQNGYYDILLPFQSNLWQIFDSLIINDQVFTQNDFDVDENTIIVFPVKSTDFYSEGELVSQYLKISGIKNRVISEKVKEISLALLTAQQRLELDNIKPSDLYVYITSDNKLMVNFYDNGSGPNKGSVWLNDQPSTYVMSKVSGSTTHFEKAIPLTQFNFGNNTLRYELEDKKGNKTSGSLDINTKELTLGHHQRFTISKDANNNVQSISFNSACLQSVYEAGDSNKIEVFKFDNYQKKWVSYKKIVKTEITPQETGNPPTTTYTTNPILFPGDADFIRVVYKPKGLEYKSEDTIVYKTIDAGSEGSNYIMLNGGAKDSVVISSEAPVYVHVCYTNKPLDVCKNWSVDQWELLASSAYETELTFSDGSKPKAFSFQPYSSQMGSYSSNRYCVIVHYANGKTGISPVFEK